MTHIDIYSITKSQVEDSKTKSTEELKYLLELQTRCNHRTPFTYLFSISSQQLSEKLFEDYLDNDGLAVLSRNQISEIQKTFWDYWSNPKSLFSKSEANEKYVAKFFSSYQEREESIRCTANFLGDLLEYRNPEIFIFKSMPSKAVDLRLKPYKTLLVFPKYQDILSNLQHAIQYMDGTMRSLRSSPYKKEAQRIISIRSVLECYLSYYKAFLNTTLLDDHYNHLTNKYLSNIVVKFHNDYKYDDAWHPSLIDLNEEWLTVIMKFNIFLSSVKIGEKTLDKWHWSLMFANNAINDACNFMNTYVDHILRDESMSSTQQLQLLNNFQKDFSTIYKK